MDEDDILRLCYDSGQRHHDAAMEEGKEKEVGGWGGGG